MNSTIKKVFLIIGILVLALLIWQLFFNEDGIIVTAYNSMASSVNNKFNSVAGGERELLPYWGSGQRDSATKVESQAGQNATAQNVGRNQGEGTD